MSDKLPLNYADPQAKNWLTHMTPEEVKTNDLITSAKSDIQNIIDQRQIPNPELKETDKSRMWEVYSLKECRACFGSPDIQSPIHRQPSQHRKSL